MKYGMRAHDISGSNLKEVKSIADKLNIKYFQLALKKTVTEFDFDKICYSVDASQYIKDCLKDTEVTVLGCYINPVDPDEVSRRKQIEFFKQNLRYAKDIGAKMVGTETGSIGTLEETHSEENYQTFLETMKELVLEAEKLGVMIGVEAVGIFTIHSPETMARFLKDIDSENVCVIFDLINILNRENCMNYKDIVTEAFTLFGDKIKVIHLKDFKIENDSFYGCLAGDGVMDYDWYFDKIRALNPDLVMMLEEVCDKELDRIIHKLPHA